MRIPAFALPFLRTVGSSVMRVVVMIGQGTKMRDAHATIPYAQNANAYARTMNNPYFVPAGRDYDTRSLSGDSIVKIALHALVTWTNLYARRMGYWLRRMRTRLG